MIVTWSPMDETGRSGLVAEPQEYDGVPPFAELWFDASPRLLGNDRLGVAAALAFGAFTKGTITMPRPVSPAVGASVARYCAGEWTNVEPVEFKPAALPVGSTDLLVGAPKDYEAENRWGAPRVVKLNVLPSHQYGGQLASLAELSLASNAWLHSTGDDPRDISTLRGQIVVAILLAESLQGDCIFVPRAVDLTRPDAVLVADLLASCRLGLDSGDY